MLSRQSVLLIWAFFFSLSSATATAAKPSLTVLDYFWLVAVKHDVASKKEDYKFPITDIKNGYLTVAPPAVSDGIVDREYVVFRGNGKHALLVSQSGECGPGCRYSYRATKFSGKAIESDGAYSKYYPLSKMKSEIRKMWSKKELKGVAKAWPQEDHFRFSLPKEGTAVKAYVIFPATDLNGRKEQYFEIGQLLWTKKQSRFRFGKGSKPIAIGTWDLY